jgi:monothiol glutaredoxin
MDESTKSRIEAMIAEHPVVLFMKGSRIFPQCGFSAKVVDILKRHGAEFKDVNVLTDSEVRQGIKEYANWPTIPQLYVRGQFVGGCDIVSEMHETGELAKLFGATTAKE